MSDLVAVEAKATLRIRTRYGRKRYADFTGTFAVKESDIAVYVERLPYRVTILEREPTSEEVAASIAAGLVPDPAHRRRTPAPSTPPADKLQDPNADGEKDPAKDTGSETPPPEKAFSQITKDPLLDIASSLGIDTEGTKVDVLERVAAYAELNNISLDGPISEVTARLTGTTDGE